MPATQRPWHAAHTTTKEHEPAAPGATAGAGRSTPDTSWMRSDARAPCEDHRPAASDVKI